MNSSEKITAFARSTAIFDEAVRISHNLPLNGIARSTAIFDEAVREHGDSYAACHWGSERSQKKRFGVLTQGLDLCDRTILDVGCGLGHFANYLHDEGVRIRGYTGVDLSGEMVAHARERVPDRNIYVCDIMQTPPDVHDVVVASGIFTFLQGDCQAIMNTLLQRMFSLCRVATLFNSLSTWAPMQEVGEFYADPLKVLAYCKTLTPWVALRCDYHPQDFTIYLYKEQN